MLQGVIRSSNTLDDNENIRNYHITYVFIAASTTKLHQSIMITSYKTAKLSEKASQIYKIFQKLRPKLGKCLASSRWMKSVGFCTFSSCNGGLSDCSTIEIGRLLEGHSGNATLAVDGGTR